MEDWKGSVTITRQKAINILNGIMWEEVSDKWLAEALEVIYYISERVIICEPISENSSEENEDEIFN